MTPGGVCCKSITAADFLGEFVASLNTARLNLYYSTHKRHLSRNWSDFCLKRLIAIGRCEHTRAPKN
jgi:hypothetical protein